LANSRRPGSLPAEFFRNTILPFGAAFRGRGVFFTLARAKCG
jgi:hypothetical protein